MMSRMTAFIAIFIAQILVMVTLRVARNRDLWQGKWSSGFAVFGLELGFVSISLLVADWLF